MAAPTESLLSLGHLTGRERNAFTKQRKPIVKKRQMLSENKFPNPTTLGNLKVMQLHQRWHQLQEREHIAQQHNRQLLQQFEKAQDVLEDMLARNAVMKTIRTEYERYLEENFQRWQQELAEKTAQAAQKKRVDDCLRSNLKAEEERVPKPTVEASLFSQGSSTSPPRNVAPQVHPLQEYSDYNQDSCPPHPYIQSWLTHPESQTGQFPIRMPYQDHTPSLFLPPNFLQPHPFLFHHLTSPPSHHYPWARNNAAGWAPSQQPYPWPWGACAAGIPPASWGELDTEEPPSEVRASQAGEEQDDTTGEQISKKESNGGSSESDLSQELDIKPVRLSSGRAESSGSGKDSSLTSKEKRKRDKSGRTLKSSSDRERCGSQQSSRNSSDIVIASHAVAQSVDRDSLTEEGGTRSDRTKRGGGLSVGSPRSENKAVIKQTETDAGDSQNYNEESQTVQTSAGEESESSNEESWKEKERNRGRDDKSGSCRTEEESESDSVKTENEAADEAEKHESRTSEQSSTEEKDEENKNLKDLEEEEYSQKSGEEEDSDVEEEKDDDDDVSGRKSTTEEGSDKEAEDKMEAQSDDEQLNKRKNEGNEDKNDSSSPQEEDVDEEGSEDSEDKVEEEDEGSNEEENRSDEAQEEGSTDSNDCIISPQEKRQRELIPEKTDDNDEDYDEEEGETGSSSDQSNEVSDDDIENLLAPQEQTKKEEEKNVKMDGNIKATCQDVDIFQMTEDRLKTDYQSDSDEFDHFYD